MNKKKAIQYDKVTEGIAGLLGSVPRVGSYLRKLYLWKPMMFNYMLVGASGTVLSWLLYEGIFRPMLAWMLGGTFLGMVVVTVIVYFWNYSWNRRWSLKPESQIWSMGRTQLLELRDQIDYLLGKKFDHNGERL